jgi:AI2M/AI1M-like, HNH endonuclease/Type II intron maturase
MKVMPSRDPADPGYRRLKYCSYADDWVLGFTGPRQEAEEIKDKTGQFLREQLKLELSPAKTLITHGRTQAARFLGYEMVVMHADDKRDHRGHRSINAGIGLKAPADFSIVAQFQAEYRGVAEYYRLAFNRHKLGRLKYVMERSLTETLARKYRISIPQVYRRYRAVLDTEHGPRRGLRVTVDREGKPPLVAQWGGISLARDTTPRPVNDDPARIWSHRSEIVQRLLADECELCGSRKQVEVHHIRALKDLNRKGGNNPPEWARRMAARRRKTLVVCRACHEGIHSGSPHGNHDEHWRAEMPGKRASPVRREAVRKGPFRHLAGGPPHRTAGSASGPGKRAGSNASTAPRADSPSPPGAPAPANAWTCCSGQATSALTRSPTTGTSWLRP